MKLEEVARSRSHAQLLSFYSSFLSPANDSKASARHWGALVIPLELTAGIRRSRRGARATSGTARLSSSDYSGGNRAAKSSQKESEAGSSLRAKSAARRGPQFAIMWREAWRVGVLGRSRNELFKAAWNNLVRPHFPTRHRLNIDSPSSCATIIRPALETIPLGGRIAGECRSNRA